MSSIIYIVAEPIEISRSGCKWSPVTMHGERKPGKSAYMVEFLMHCNVDARLNYVSMYINRPQDMIYRLQRYEEETPVSNKKNSQVMKRASIREDLCDYPMCC